MGKDQNIWGGFMKVKKTNKEIDNILRLNSRKIVPEFPQLEASWNSLVENVLKRPEPEGLKNIFLRNVIHRL